MLMTDPDTLAPQMSERFDHRIRNLVKQINVYLDDISEQAPLPANLREAAHYALLGGGKRLRPVLVLLAAEAVAKDVDRARTIAMAPAAALEMIHAFSLVHDDLPAMDDDDLRRGRPTLHRHTSEAMAILAGDVLLSHAVTVVARADVSAETARRLIQEIIAATTAMISGQVYDTLGGLPGEMPDQARMTIIHENKTAALIRASCRCGAIAGGGAARQIEALSQYGQSIGTMFQLVDDLLDVTQSAEHTGKKTNKDIEAGKLTAPMIFGVDGTRREIDRCRAEALDALRNAGLRDDAARDFTELCLYLAERTR